MIALNRLNRLFFLATLVISLRLRHHPSLPLCQGLFFASFDFIMDEIDNWLHAASTTTFGKMWRLVNTSIVLQRRSST